VENPARTERFLSLLEDRRAALRATFSTIFPQPASFVCEFGCGHGHFLVAYAQAHPNEFCVGVDIEGDRIERAARKQRRAKADHLHFIQADAGLFLETLPPGQLFRHVFILFPDPWPKKRHHKHRLIQPAFLDHIQLRATDETRIYFRTDYEPYFKDARATFEQHPHWQVTDEPWVFEHETVFQSRATSFRSLVVRPRPAAP
jgi:tRNA (guanine-N7-)-methyltransferase